MSEALNELMRRCEGAGLEYMHNPSFGETGEVREPTSLGISLPKGRKSSLLMVSEGEAAEALLEVPFEGWRVLSGYRALWSPEGGEIECAVDHAGSNRSILSLDPGSLRQVLEREGYEAGVGSLLTSGQRTEFAAEGGLKVSIGSAGKFHQLLFWATPDVLMVIPGRLETVEIPMTLRVEGARASSHDVAVELLRRVGDSLFFGLDLSFGLSLTLARERTVTLPLREGSERAEARAPEPPPSVRYEYDSAPMSLYWYARGATGMPLLRFLAYYQILEFYFPVYSERRAQDTLRNLLKDPTFDPDRDADMARLLRSVKAGSGGRGFGNEQSQLKATVAGCVSAEELREFLLSGEERYRFYTSNEARKVAEERLRVKEEDDQREAVAKRIYAIRNRIVHTKGAGEGDDHPLLPFDPEVSYLGHDTDLVAFLARKALVASSRPMRS